MAQVIITDSAANNLHAVRRCTDHLEGLFNKHDVKICIDSLDDCALITVTPEWSIIPYANFTPYWKEFNWEAVIFWISDYIGRMYDDGVLTSDTNRMRDYEIEARLMTLPLITSEPLPFDVLGGS